MPTNYNPGTAATGCDNGRGFIHIAGIQNPEGVGLIFRLTSDEAGNVELQRKEIFSMQENTDLEFNGLENGRYYVHVEELASNENYVYPGFLQITCTACDEITGVREVNGQLVIDATKNNPARKEYSLDGFNFQAENEFTHPGPGTHTVYFRAPGGCSDNFTFTVVCELVLGPVTLGNGTATIAATTAPGRLLLYSLDGVQWQLSPEFSGLTPKTYEYFVKDAIGCAAHATFEIKAPDAVILNNGRCFLVYDGIFYSIPQPIGYDAFERFLKRDLTYFGIGYEMSEMQLQFSCSHGADLIRDVYGALGPEAEILLYIYPCNRNSGPPYVARLNLYDYNDDLNIIKCSVEKSSFQDGIKNRFRTKVQIGNNTSLDGVKIAQALPAKIKLHSRAIVKRHEAFGDGIPVTSFTIDKNGPFPTPNIALGFNNIKVDELEKFYQGATGFSFEDNRFEFFEAVESGTLNIEYKIDLQTGVIKQKGDFDRVRLEVFFQKNDEAPAVLYTYSGHVSGDFNRLVNIAGTRTAAVQPGDVLYLYGKIEVSELASPFLGTWELVFNCKLADSSFIKVSAQTTTAESYSTAFLPYELLNNAAALVSSKENIVISDFYGRTNSAPAYPVNGDGAFLAAMNGFMVRGFPADKGAFSAALGDIVDGYRAIHAIGYGYEVQADREVIRVEPLEYFFQDEEADRFDIIESYSESTATDWIYNEVQIGFEKWGDEDINGLDEFNAKHTYSLPIKKHKKTFEGLSKFIGSGYTLELTRRKRYDAESSRDYKHDNSTFVVSVNPAAVSREFAIIGYGGPGLIYVLPEALFLGMAPGVVFAVSAGPNAGNYIALTTKFIPHPTAGFVGAVTITGVFPYPENLEGRVLLSQLYTAEQAGPFAIIQNSLNPGSIYNARISPKRNLLNWAPLLNTSLYYAANTEKYRFAAGEGNYKFATQFTAAESVLLGDLDRDLLTEGADVLITKAQQGKTLFKPVIMNVKIRIPETRFDNLAAKMYKYFSVWTGKEYKKGYILEAKYKPEDQAATLKLIQKAGPVGSIDNPPVSGNTREFNAPEFNPIEFN